MYMTNYSELLPKVTKGRPKKVDQDRKHEPAHTIKNCLLDNGQNTINLTGKEKIFYEDQKQDKVLPL